jgi:acyl-coenzyme A thioesterase PaaI-like protein
MGFAVDIAPSRRDDTTFDAEVHAGWDIGGNANGGYLLAIVGRAVTEATGKPHPVTTTAHYLAPAKAGPVTVDVDVVRSGRRHATARAALRSADATHIVALSTTADLADGGEALLVDGTPPELPDPETCARMAPAAGGPPSFAAKVDMRLHPDDGGFMDGASTGRARMRGWFRLADGEALDPLALLLASDGFPPTIFNTDLPVGWTPTVELTTHVRGVPAPGWLACAFSTRFVTGGYLEADGEIWDSAGTLVAQSRQLALVPRPSEL